MTNTEKTGVLDVIKHISPEIYAYALVLYNDIKNRPAPQPGDKYEYGESIIVFEKLMFDPDFKQGVAFNYIFHDEADESKKITIHSIHDINSEDEDDYILNINDIKDMYGFWKYTYPINK